MILYGRNPVREALRGHRASSIGEVWATQGAAREPWLQGSGPQEPGRRGSGPQEPGRRETRSRGSGPPEPGRQKPGVDIRVRISSAAEIECRCGSSAHQGVCAEAGGYPYVSAAELLAGPEPLVVALDEIQDPHNLGSICRTAECAGASGVAIPERRAAEITPAACSASAGAVEHLRVARVRNLADFLGLARDAGCWCYGAEGAEDAGGGGSGGGRSARSSAGALLDPVAGGARRTPIPYDEPDYAGAGIVLVLGSEGRGLRPRVAGACDELIALPLRGRVASLGVSAAAAALLYEILQSRTRSP